MTSLQSSNPNQDKPDDEHRAKWYPWHGEHGPTHQSGGRIADPEFLYSLIREQKLEYESKFLSLKNELITVRNEVLTLRETILNLQGENKLRLVIDERKRNALIRKHIPCPFVPEHTTKQSSSDSK